MTTFVLKLNYFFSNDVTSLNIPKLRGTHKYKKHQKSNTIRTCRIIYQGSTRITKQNYTN